MTPRPLCTTTLERWSGRTIARRGPRPPDDAAPIGLTLARELGTSWRAPLSPDPSVAEEIAAWEADVESVHAAWHRVQQRRRVNLIRWHRAELEALEAAS